MNHRISTIRRDLNPVPLWQKGLRGRLRLKHLLSWGLVTLTVSIFFALMFYTSLTQREWATQQDAARSVLPVLVIIQAVLLMMSGTSAVAAGISRERDEGLLDYVRMTPMGPTSKILGYLFGLPAREYVLFALTMPIVIVAAILGDFPAMKILHFYAVFFTSVWVYHLTALVAGMVTPRPRAASMLAIGMVVVLYFVLPNLSRIGLTFFEFLTIRPTFFGLVLEEMPPNMRPQLEASGIDSFRDVPIFGTALHPTVYTLIVQGFVIATMFSIVHRKWRDEAHHVFSKVGGTVAFAGVTAFLLGSVWAIVAQDEAYEQVFGRLREFIQLGGGRAPETLEITLIASFAVIGLVYLLMVFLITPSRDRTVEGWRRVRKLGRARLGLNSDATSSLPFSVAMLVLCLAGGYAIIRLAGERGDYFAAGPSFPSMLVVAGSVLATGLVVQGLRERFGVRVSAMILFVIWAIPFFSMMILFGAFEAEVAGTYVGLPFPPFLVGLALGEMMQTITPLEGTYPEFLPDELARLAGPATVVGTILYSIAAVLVQLEAWRWRRTLAVRSLQGRDETLAPASDTATSSARIAVPGRAGDAAVATTTAPYAASSDTGEGPRLPLDTAVAPPAAPPADLTPARDAPASTPRS